MGKVRVRGFAVSNAIDEMHLAISPLFLGGGESLFEGVVPPALEYRVTDVVPTELATHIVLTR